MNVQQRIAAIIGDLPAIEKNDRGEGVSYKFRGIETLVGHLAGLLAKHGVVIAPSTTLIEINREVENSKGKMPGWTETIISVDWTIHGADGDTLTARTLGIGRDNSDKGSNKAQTQAYKYLLMELFAIGDKEDDGDGHPPAPADVPVRPSAVPPARSAPASGREAPSVDGPPSPEPPVAPSPDGTPGRVSQLMLATNGLGIKSTALLIEVGKCAQKAGVERGELAIMLGHNAVWELVREKYAIA